jgi:short-subunit dehydrogenase
MSGLQPVTVITGASAGIGTALARVFACHGGAEAGYRGLMQGLRSVVPGLVNKAVATAIRLVPRRFLLALVDARQRRRRSAPRT